MEQKGKTVIVLYEIEQIAEMQDYFEQKKIPLDTCTIIPLEFEVEHTLRERDIRCTSRLEYLPIDEEFSAVIEPGQKAARQFHEHHATQFFSYQGINLGEVFEPILDMYTQYLGNHIHIFKCIAEKCEIKEV